MTFQVLLFYKYVTIEDPATFAGWFLTRAKELGLKGRARIAEEGLNATLEGELSQTEQFIQALKQDPRFTDLKVKTSVGDGNSFPKLSVKTCKEIVGTRFSQTEADPRVRTAPYISPEELHTLYQQKDDFVVVDMRNSYEFASGHFQDSIDPGMRASRDLAQAVVKLEPYKEKKIITVCTGGIRCEKMSAYLLNKGFKNVQQLEDGMHAYMQKYPGQDFVGTLYTFDGRITMDFSDDRPIVGTCHRCQKKTERYLNCANDACHLHLLLCEACAPSEKEAYCSPMCRLQAFFIKQSISLRKHRRETAYNVRKIKRRLKKKALRMIWKIRIRTRALQTTH